MKVLRALFFALTGAVLLQPSISRADVDFAFFYDELSPYGNWVDVDDYGYCFQPNVGSGWSPYSDGYWADSDEGWVWVSNEPYGWATYHYGRWTQIGGGNWVWVPGYEWGPAWVSWRENNDYVGWAPLPPQVAYRPQTGIRFGISFGFGDVGPGYYNFVPTRYFGYDGVRDYFVPRSQNVNIIEQTTNITNISNVVNNNRTVIYNAGPNRDMIRSRADRPIRRYQIDRDGQNLTADQLRKRGLRNEVNGDRLRVVSPKVNRGNGDARPKNVTRKVSKAELRDGYADISDKKRADEVRKRVNDQANNPKDQKRFAKESGGGQGANKANGGGAGKSNNPNRDEVLKKQTNFEKSKPRNADKEKAEREREMRQAAEKGKKNNGTGQKKADKPQNDNKPAGNQGGGNAPKKADKPKAEKKQNSNQGTSGGNAPKKADKPKAEKKPNSNQGTGGGNAPKKADKPKAEKKQSPSNSQPKPQNSKPQGEKKPQAKQQPKQQQQQAQKKSGGNGGGQAQQKQAGGGNQDKKDKKDKKD